MILKPKSFDFKSFEISMILICKTHSKSKSFYDILIKLNIIKLFHGLDETMIDYSLQDVNFAVTFYLQFTTDNKIFIKTILVSEPKMTKN